MDTQVLYLTVLGLILNISVGVNLEPISLAITNPKNEYQPTPLISNVYTPLGFISKNTKTRLKVFTEQPTEFSKGMPRNYVPSGKIVQENTVIPSGKIVQASIQPSYRWGSTDQHWNPTVKYNTAATENTNTKTVLKVFTEQPTEFSKDMPRNYVPSGKIVQASIQPSYRWGSTDQHWNPTVKYNTAATENTNTKTVLKVFTEQPTEFSKDMPRNYVPSGKIVQASIQPSYRWENTDQHWNPTVKYNTAATEDIFKSFTGNIVIKLPSKQFSSSLSTPSQNDINLKKSEPEVDYNTVGQSVEIIDIEDNEENLDILEEAILEREENAVLLQGAAVLFGVFVSIAIVAYATLFVRGKYYSKHLSPDRQVLINEMEYYDRDDVLRFFSV